LLPWLLFTI